MVPVKWKKYRLLVEYENNFDFEACENNKDITKEYVRKWWHVFRTLKWVDQWWEQFSAKWE